jgi:sortase A
MADTRQGVSFPGPAETFLRRAQYVLFFAGLLALTYAGVVVVERQIYQAKQARELEHAATVDLRTPPPVGFVIGKVKIPRIGLQAVVVQGDSEKILRLAVGHMPGTALPDQLGNMVLAGHRDSFFRPLRNIRAGDIILVERPNGSYDYQVESTSIVAPTDLSVLQNSGNKELTLITCYPFSWIGSAPDRFVVRARQIGL